MQNNTLPTATNSTTAPVPKRPRTGAIATKKPRQPPPAASTATARISEQDLFIIHCRDNLVPGATGTKDWDAVTTEFHARFAAVLKKPLKYNTLQKRYGTARKVYVRENPVSEDGDEGGEENGEDRDED
jgi:hypothetical protein